MTVKNSLISILDNYCPDNVYLQGTLNANETYPDTFITFFITDSEFGSFYDDDANRVNWFIAVMIYSTDPNQIDTISSGIIRDLKAAGFVPENAGNDIPSDVETHTGWAIDFTFIEKITNEV